MSPKTCDLIESAAHALGQVQQITLSSPLLRGWYWRETIIATALHAAHDNAAVDKVRLCAALQGLRLSNRSLLKDGGSLQKAIFLHELLYTYPEESIDGYAAELPLCDRNLIIRHLKSSPKYSLSKASEFLWELMTTNFHDIEADISVIRACVPHILFHGNKQPYMPVCGSKSFSIKTNDFAIWRDHWLKCLHSEAISMIARHAKLYSLWKQTKYNIPGIRRSRSLHNTIDIIAQAGLLSPTLLHKTLNVSLKRAGAILEELCELNLIIEITKRRTHKLYGLRDFDELVHVTDGPKSNWKRIEQINNINTQTTQTTLLPHNIESPPKIETDLESLFSELDRANAKASFVLKAYEK